VWKEPNRNRLVYILGTAHISKVSADLAGQLVRDVHPNAVFVELDLKRVDGVAQYVKQQQDLKDSIEQVTLPPGTSNTSLEANNPPKQSTVIVPVPTPPVATEKTAPSQPRGLFGDLRQKALNVGAQVVGSAVRGMYQNLGDQGFSPGEEFAAAIMEAQKQGADVILGDQDVQITLRRLTQALASTDLSKLNDDALSSKFSDLMGGGKAMELPPSGVMDDIYKEEFTKMVESMKNRENVRAIMTELKEVAPALAQVMLTERDAYMATGIDTLNQFECIVAVMGIAHMDGVENNLRGRGWTQVAPNCASL
jgi:pheromone shutdown protein TraB